MVNATVIFIVVIIVVAIIAVIISVVVVNRQKQDSGGGPVVPKKDPGGWGPQEDGPDSKHNFCGVYTFPATSPSQPAPITLDTTILNGLTPVPFSEVECVDSDQVAAKQIQQTCLGDGVFKGICYGSDGKIVKTGEKRVLYVECQKAKCKDTLATVALNFNPLNLMTETGCLEVDRMDLTKPIKIERCDLTSPGQLFRIDRQDAEGKSDPSGPYGRIFDRSTGKCVVPTAQNPTVGNKLVLGDCSPVNGYVWWFFPPQTVKDPYDGPTKGVNTLAPQQFVYFPNPGKLPPGVGEVTKFIEKNMPVSIAAPVKTMITGPFPLTEYGQDVEMERMAVNINSDQKYNSQTIDYWLYQVITMVASDSSTGTNFPWYQPEPGEPT
uniref:Membrane protein n=1 Tax=Pithovirus LCPAC201 TaxID=2506591 RepID=A0A481Z5H3_9VIRU|nr:MAG: membrane protein [Pithovirus LCPAC201]